MIRVFIAHPGKQHTQNLINACIKSGIYLMLFTIIAPNPEKLTFLPAKLHKLLSKRKFEGIASKNIIQYPYLFPLFKLWGGKAGISLFSYRIFDRLVAHSIRKKDYDLIIAYENANLETFSIAKKSGKITVLDLAAVHHSQNQVLWQKFSAYQNYIGSSVSFERMNAYKEKALSKTDYCFCLSEYARSTMIQGGYPPDRIFVTYLGTDMLRFANKKVYTSRDKGELQLIFVGTISLLKGVDVLFEVMNRLKALPIRLLLVGPVGTNSHLLDKLPSNCTYQPFLFREELGTALLGADVFVTGSYTDSWAQTVIEAMACGTPVIVSQNTGAKEAVEQGGGFIVPTGDADAYVEKILYLYHNRGTIETMGRQARKVAEQYTWENYHKQVQAALKEIARRENITW